MKDFYTNVFRRGNFIYYTEISDDKHYHHKTKYSPFLFVLDKNGEYKTIHGKSLGRRDFLDMYEAKEFVTKHEDITNFDLFGMNDYVYPFMNDKWTGKIEYDRSKINVVSLDIETMSDGGYPNILEADKAITVITLSKNDKYVVVGVGDFVTDREDVVYYNCENEYQLLTRFLAEYKKMNPDVLTGWNIDFFDIPYLINRITRVLGESSASSMSPWSLVSEREVYNFGRKQQTYLLWGVSIIDYMATYKKWRGKVRESYKLDHIASVELGMGKTDYSIYGSLDGLYKNNYQLYVEYNIRDTEIINQLEDKLKLMELIFAIAYDAKINFNDAFSPVKTWDVIIHNHLLENSTAIPFKKLPETVSGIVGGYVKTPIPQMYKWVVSFDLNSLYPHLIMQYNISPEKFRGMYEERVSVEYGLDGGFEEYHNYLVQNNFALTPNGCLWDRDGHGFLPSLMLTYYNDRKKFKKLMLEENRLFEETGELIHSKMSTQFDMFQKAKKVLLNAAYGALCNAYFRWNNSDFGEAITTSGQLAIRWVANDLNKYLNKILKTDNKDYIIAADTDSVYLNLEKLVDKILPNKDIQDTVKYIDSVCEKILTPYIDKSYERLAQYVNAYEQKMVMKREAIADKGIWTGKKHYILNVWDMEGVRHKEKAELKIMGIESVKSSTPKIVRDYINKSIDCIMNKTENDLITYIAQCKSNFSERKYEEVAFPRGLNNLVKYSNGSNEWKKGTPIHVRGAFNFNNLCRERGLDKTVEALKDGDKIRFSYLTVPNPSGQNVISVLDTLPNGVTDIGDYIDYNMQFEKAFINPLRKITDVIGWKTEHISTLEDMFG